MSFFRRLPTYLILALILPSLGCVATRLNRFNTFAQAGLRYTVATQTVTQGAGNATVNTDSALLLKYRPDLTEPQRRQRVTTSNDLLRQRLQVLRLIGAHSKLLQAYFEALAALSDPKAPNSVGTDIQGAYDSLAKMSPPLKSAKIGSTSVSSFIPKLATPIVARFKVHALDAELKARAGAITEELALQEAALTAMEEELKTDAQLQQNFREVDNVNQFASAAPLPTEWTTQRLIILSTPPVIASIDAASKASTDLRKAFAALIENRFDTAEFETLMNDISNIISISQNIQTTAK